MPAQKVTHAGFVYSLLREVPRKSYWHCTRSFVEEKDGRKERKKCTGRVHTNHEGEVVYVAGEHRHPPTALAQAHGIRGEPNGNPVGRARLSSIVEIGHQDAGAGPLIPVNAESAVPKTVKADLRSLDPDNDGSVIETNRRASLALVQAPKPPTLNHNGGSHADVITMDETEEDNELRHSTAKPRSSRERQIAVHEPMSAEWLEQVTATAHRYSAGQTPATIPEVISLVEANEQNDRPVELSPEDLGKMNIAESTTTPIVEEPDEDPRNTWALRQMQRPIRLDEIPAGQAAVRVKRGDMTFEICGSFLCSRCDSNNTRCFQRTSKCVYCCAHESCEIK
ncbi:FLYWCH zinc finger domain-containing protein [Ditylenchus destructor]|nr:FLYWCH zinc finger domain-containing protein [Ditylenchus destructor]